MEADIQTDRIASFDGTKLAIHRTGEGPPVLLLHGLFSSAQMNWIKFGHAARLAEAGFSVIMPDLRAHGASEAPHEAAAYPPDVLLRDLRAMVEALGLEEYDLGGFSLGARTSAAAVIDGLTPRRLILGGMGLSGLAGWDRRADFFIDAIDRFDTVERGDPAWLSVQFMKTMQVDRAAARLLLQAVTDIESGELEGIPMPVLVVCGEDDRDNGSPEDLVEALPDARLKLVPGTHMSSVTEAAMSEEMVRFLRA